MIFCMENLPEQVFARLDKGSRQLIFVAQSRDDVTSDLVTLAIPALSYASVRKRTETAAPCIAAKPYCIGSTSGPLYEA
jgi:hypothetical protein